MFLLLLIGLRAAGVKAQVRIGGNTPPDASAILDLNADGTSNGTKGLALPRVALTSNTMLLPGVTANLTGMLVYNTSTSGTVKAIGIYYWNGATWVLASLPSTLPSDSGSLLRSNGTSWVISLAGVIKDTVTATVTNYNNPAALTLIGAYATTLDRTLLPLDMVYVNAPGVYATDMCYAYGTFFTVLAEPNGFVLVSHAGIHRPGMIVYSRCFRITY